MCEDFRFICIACGYEWVQYGTGVFVPDLYDTVRKCSECGGETLHVSDGFGHEPKDEVIDFTKANKNLIEKIDRMFFYISERFKLLSTMERETDDYISLKNELMRVINFSSIKEQ